MPTGDGGGRHRERLADALGICQRCGDLDAERAHPVQTNVRDVADGVPVDLRWLLGMWEGTGQSAAGVAGPAAFHSRLHITAAGQGLLRHDASRWALTADAEPAELVASESGFWRAGSTREGTLATVEVVLTDGEGTAAAWTGITEVLGIDAEAITSARVRLVTDAVARTPTAPPVAGGERLYGLFNGTLVWTEDVATDDAPLVNVRWGQLSRRESPIDADR